MKQIKHLNLQKKIGLLVLSGLVVGLSLFAWIGVQAVQETIDRALNERLAIARIIAGNLDGTVKRVLSHLQYAADTDGVIPTAKEFSFLASTLRKTLANSGVSAQSILLLNGDGRIIQVEPDDAVAIGLDLSGYREVREALDLRHPTISGSLSGPLARGTIVVATAPILDRSGNAVGAIASSLSSEELGISALGLQVTIGVTGYVEVVDRDGLVLARTRPGQPPEPFESSDHPGRFSDLISKRAATVGTCHRCHETSEFYRQSDVLAFAPLSTASWGVAVRQTEEEALAPARQLEGKLLSVGMLVLAVVLIMVWLIIRGIVTPLKALTTATGNISAGQFGTVGLSKRTDEIGQLANAFHSMAKELGRSRNDLERRNEGLAALNSVAAAVSQSLNLDEVLFSALKKVLEITGAGAGSALAMWHGDGEPEATICLGWSTVFQYPLHGRFTADCACHEVISTCQTGVAMNMSHCPVLRDLTKEQTAHLISLPLRCRNLVVGVMNIDLTAEHRLTQNDFTLLEPIGHHVGLAIENACLYKRAKEKEKLRGYLLTQTIAAQEEERKRIARELHDEHGQALAGLIMSIESLESVVPLDSKLRTKLNNTKSLVNRALLGMRKLILDLRPSMLDELGLVSAVRAYALENLGAAGVHVEFSSTGLDRRLPPAVEAALFRIIQEACRNVIRHARASHVQIDLKGAGEKVIALIADNGSGFESSGVLKSRTGSLGLLGMKERVTLLGGDLDIESRAGDGTRLIVRIPLPDTEPVEQEGAVR